ncbi:MAG: hypothetical protein AAFY57_18485 [Cyanobacteria bacterium J06642_2]
MWPFDLLLVSDREVCQRAGRTVPTTIELALRNMNASRVAVLRCDKQSSIADVIAQIAALQPITHRAGGALLLVHRYPGLQAFEDLD